MIETLSFFAGAAFSVVVYALAIRPAPYSPLRKAVYGILSTIGITGMVWLSGVLIAHALRKHGLIP